MALINCVTGDDQAHLWAITPAVKDEESVGPNVQLIQVGSTFSNVSFL